MQKIALRDHRKDHEIPHFQAKIVLVLMPHLAFFMGWTNSSAEHSLGSSFIEAQTEDLVDDVPGIPGV